MVYEPLLNRLPAGTPMIGLERVEGTIEERAAQYVPKLLELNGWADGTKGKPFILAGWSLGPHQPRHGKCRKRRSTGGGQHLSSVHASQSSPLWYSGI